MSRKLYAAYGSNLNFSQMKVRCPAARFVGSGEAHGYRLSFKGGYCSAVATIEPSSRSSVPIGVWAVTEGDELALDRYEGYPNLYQKQTLHVELTTGEKINAMVYTINPALTYGLPSKTYYGALFAGYKDCGLDTDYLIDAVRYSAEMMKNEAEAEEDLDEIEQEEDGLDADEEGSYFKFETM